MLKNKNIHKHTKFRLFRKICKFTFLFLILAILIGILSFWLLHYDTLQSWKNETITIINNSNKEDFNSAHQTIIYDDDNNVIAELSTPEKMVYLRYENMPKQVGDAFIAVEDRSFWKNKGYDLKGIIRVCLNYIKTKGEVKNGASTITQQLVRMKYLSTEVSMERKIKEILLAIEITNKYTKQDILEFYINNCCFANNIYGIEAASETYFEKNVNDLTLSQIAYLCAIPNRPEYYNPYTDATRALNRRDKILNNMYECGFITENELTHAMQEEIIIVPKKATSEKQVNDYQTTYALHCVIKELMKNDGFEFKYSYTSLDDYKKYQEQYNEKYEEEKNKLYNNTYIIRTSLNKDAQEIVQKSLNQILSQDTSLGENGVYQFQGSATVIDNRTQKVIAIVGGRQQDEFSSTYTLNRAIKAYRQPGSSIKPILVYTPALMNDYDENSQIKDINVKTVNQIIKNEQGLTESAKEKIQKLNGTNYALKDAVAKSKNGCAENVLCDITPEYALPFLNEMHFDRIVPSDYNLSSALGGLTYGTTTEQMAGAYTTLVNQGQFVEPTCITSIKDKYGNELHTDDKPQQIYTAKASTEMIDVLKTVFTNGTATKLNWGKSSQVEAAGKTGTTNNSKDGWFCGMTPYYTMSVWVGYDTPKELDSLHGNSYPAQIWKESMLALLDQQNISTGTFKHAETAKEPNSTNIINRDYSDTDETIMPGRDDNEELSTGYYVGDYRNDTALKSEVQNICNRIEVAINENEKQELITEAEDKISMIYGTTIKNEAQAILNAVK